MLKKMAAAIMVTVFFGAGGLSTPLSYGETAGQLLAHSEHGKKKETSGTSTFVPEKRAETAKRMMCPVSGEEIDGKTNITYEYKGKTYNFCCQDCADAFKKDPEKYIEKKEEGTNGAGRQDEPAHGDHH